MAIKLFTHQQKGVEIARDHKRFAFFWKPGTGKTMAILAIQKERPLRTLVVAQRSIIQTAWINDAATMEVELEVVMNTNKPKRMAAINRPGSHILVTNYEQFRIHYKDFMATGIERIVFDESSKLKNRNSKTTQAAIIFADSGSVEECYLLSGTPAPNTPIELWAQLRVLSPEASGGKLFWKFANHFFVPDYSFAKGGKRVISGWKFKVNAEPVFQDHVRKFSWALMKEECLDLPKQTDQIRQVKLSPNESKTYTSISEDLRLAAKVGESPDGIPQYKFESVKAAAVLMKLRQVTGGSVLTGSGGTALGTAKIDELMTFMDEVGPKEPVLIWAEFTNEIDRIATAIRKRGETVEIIDGRTKDSGGIVRDFLSGQIRRIIAHPQAAGHGTDGLQKVCKYAVYFSMSFSSEMHEQSRDRLHRSGQTSPVTYVYLIAPGTVDEGIFRVVREKQAKQKALLDCLKRN